MTDGRGRGGGGSSSGGGGSGGGGRGSEGFGSRAATSEKGNSARAGNAGNGPGESGRGGSDGAALAQALAQQQAQQQAIQAQQAQANAVAQAAAAEKAASIRERRADQALGISPKESALTPRSVFSGTLTGGLMGLATGGFGGLLSGALQGAGTSAIKGGLEDATGYHVPGMGDVFGSIRDNGIGGGSVSAGNNPGRSGDGILPPHPAYVEPPAPATPPSLFSQYQNKFAGQTLQWNPTTGKYEYGNTPQNGGLLTRPTPTYGGLLR